MCDYQKPVLLVAQFDARQQGVEVVLLCGHDSSFRGRSIAVSADGDNSGGRQALIGESVSEPARILSWSPGAQALYGWTASEVIGHAVSILFASAEYGVEVALRARVGRGEHLENVRLNRLDSKGRPVAVWVSMSPLLDELGALTGIVGHSFRASRADAHASDRQPTQWVRTMVDALDVGIVLSQNSPGSHLYANPAAYRILGFDPDQPWPETTERDTAAHRDDAVELIVELEEAALTTKVDRREVPLVRADDSVRWVRAASTAVENLDGTAAQTVSMFQDITSLKEVEAALQESLGRFDQMASSIEIGFILRDIASEEFVYVSPAIPRIFGFDAADGAITFETFRRYYHPDDINAVRAAALQAQSGKHTSVDARIVRPDGQMRWLRIGFGPVASDSGAVVRLGGSFEDVTTQRDTDRKLRASQEQFSRTADALDIGVSLRDIDSTRFLYANRRYVELAGFDPTIEDQAPLTSAMSRIHPDDREAMLAGYWHSTQQGRSAHAEVRVIQPTGENRWLGISSHPVATGADHVRLAAGTLEDITDRKHAEALLRSAREEALEANRAKSDFLSRMSHELRTPLNAVLGFAQLLNMDSLSESQSQSVSHILRGGQRLVELDVSRIDTDQLHLAADRIRVADAIGQVITLGRAGAESQGVEVVYQSSVADADRYVRADRRRLRQVLLKVLSNAIEYCDTDGRVEICCRLDGASDYAISVRDTGAGIAPDELERLFRPFEYLGAHGSKGDGTGIGLALSHRLVTMMQGRLEVESQTEVGSIFTVVLPRADADATSDQGRGARERTMLLLYVDNDQDNVDLVKSILRSRPRWTLINAVDGATALQLAVTHRPTLVMLDLHLSDKEGLEVLRTLTTNPATSQIPVVVTADATPEVVARARRAGAGHCITKPYVVADLLRVLDSYESTVRR